MCGLLLSKNISIFIYLFDVDIRPFICIVIPSLNATNIIDNNKYLNIDCVKHCD